MTETSTPDGLSNRFARWFASPASVLILMPALVVAVGLVVLMLGRRATRDSADTMARHQLVAQASQVQHDVEVTLDQADPVIASLRLLAEPALPTPDAMQRLHDVVLGRSGIANASIAFPVGVMWRTLVEKTTGELQVQESRVAADHSETTTYGFKDGLHVAKTEITHYDPRTRPHYTLAVAAKKRVWMPPHVFSSSHKTGLTATEPIYDTDGSLTAVLTIDFDVETLSASISSPPLDGARTVVFTADGAILAYPAVPLPNIATAENRVLRYEDYADPTLDAMFAALGHGSKDQRFLHLVGTDDSYLAAVSPVGGTRAGDWYLATLVPEHTLFGATADLGRQTIIASALALLIALGVALMFAWNLIRMRRAVGVARAAAQSAIERASELGSYRLVNRLGVGGMGEVWRAEHQLLARQAAIKLVRREMRADLRHAALIQERFRREAQTLASLRSRHTIALYDYGVTAEGAFFYVMELLDGLDLAQLVKTHGPQPAARVIHMLTQACSSLAEAHDAGLLHRDIKPANLFLCRAADEVDIIKLLDFGIAHNLAEPVEPLPPTLPVPAEDQRLTVEGSVIGTPGYIPPEQATGATLDARGDLYALGCVAWCLLTGEEVYTPGPGQDLVRMHVTEPIPDLRAATKSWIPEGLEALVVSCLAKSPEDRPRDARALAAALAEIEIPADRAWTKADATAWWKHLAIPGASSADAPTVGAAPRIVKATAVVSATAMIEQRTVSARPSR